MVIPFHSETSGPVLFKNRVSNFIVRTFTSDKSELKKNQLLNKVLEWFGVITAIAYSMLVASNTGNEVIGFSLLFLSAVSIGLWAMMLRHFGIFLLQFFYASAGILGVIRWF